MAIGYVIGVRNSRMNAVRDAVDAGAGAGLVRIYDGTQPATGGTATTLLAEGTCSDPCAPNASNGVLTFSAITQDSSANATGTATWFRVVDSTGTAVFDGTAGTSGTDMILNSAAISAGVIVQFNSLVLTEGNP